MLCAIIPCTVWGRHGGRAPSSWRWDSSWMSSMGRRRDITVCWCQRRSAIHSPDGGDIGVGRPGAALEAATSGPVHSSGEARQSHSAGASSRWTHVGQLYRYGGSSLLYLLDTRSHKMIACEGFSFFCFL
jgi:hypothetical protein